MLKKIFVVGMLSLLFVACSKKKAAVDFNDKLVI